MGADAAELIRRIDEALRVASENAMYYGEHHKMWVIDQMVRNLTGCPLVRMESPRPDANGQPYTYMGLAESDEYRAFVGDEEWDEGVAP